MAQAVAYSPCTEIQEFLTHPQRLFIGNDWLEPQGEGSFPVYDPSTGRVIGHAAEGTTEDVDLAVEAAADAFDAWAAMPPSQRGLLLWRLSDLIERDADYLAELDMLNVGLPLDRMRRGVVPAMIDNLRYYAGWATKVQGDTLPVASPGVLAYTLKEPVGVCGAIIPWNFPLTGISGKLGPALVTGNTVVLKPAEETPLSAIWIGRLVKEAGFPPGVVNIVTGYGEVAGAALAAHRRVDKVGFTGSTEVGREIVGTSRSNLKRISLELGGKTPHVIFGDSDLTLAAKTAVWAIFTHNGQNCNAGSRLYIERTAYEEVMERVIDHASQIVIGPAWDARTEVGPLISQAQLARVKRYIQYGLEEGATLVLGGDEPSGVPDGGFYLNPTVFVDAAEHMRIVQEEIFGPVLTVLPFDDFEEAVRAANSTPYGLSAAIWTRDMQRAHEFSRKVRAGAIWVNGHGLADSVASFGGFKNSGYGRELGEASLAEYLESKTVWIAYDPLVAQRRFPKR